MYTPYIMDTAILCFIALFAARLQIIVNPPYNTGAKDWKYNNDYVDGSDSYRHSKWLSFMEKRLKLAKKLLNPKDSVLIVTIDDVEVHTLTLLLQEVFSESYTQVVSSVINPSGKVGMGFSVVHEYIVFVFIGSATITNTSEDMLFVENGKGDQGNSPFAWESLLRRGSNWTPASRPNLFYPVLVDEEKQSIVGVGQPIDPQSEIPTHTPFIAVLGKDGLRMSFSPLLIKSALSRRLRLTSLALYVMCAEHQGLTHPE